MLETNQQAEIPGQETWRPKQPLSLRLQGFPLLLTFVLKEVGLK